MSITKEHIKDFYSVLSEGQEALLEKYSANYLGFLYREYHLMEKISQSESELKKIHTPINDIAVKLIHEYGELAFFRFLLMNKIPKESIDKLKDNEVFQGYSEMMVYYLFSEISTNESNRGTRHNHAMT